MKQYEQEASDEANMSVHGKRVAGRSTRPPLEHLCTPCLPTNPFDEETELEGRLEKTRRN